VMRVGVYLSYYDDDHSLGQTCLVAAWLVAVGILSGVEVVPADLEIVCVDLMARVENWGISHQMAGAMAATRHRSIAKDVTVMVVRNLLLGI
jgi:hypothetical protein